MRINIINSLDSISRAKKRAYVFLYNTIPSPPVLSGGKTILPNTDGFVQVSDGSEVEISTAHNIDRLQIRGLIGTSEAEPVKIVGALAGRPTIGNGSTTNFPLYDFKSPDSSTNYEVHFISIDANNAIGISAIVPLGDNINPNMVYSDIIAFNIDFAGFFANQNSTVNGYGNITVKYCRFFQDIGVGDYGGEVFYIGTTGNKTLVNLPITTLNINNVWAEGFGRESVQLTDCLGVDISNSTFYRCGESRPEGSVTLSGASGSVDGILVDGVEVMSGAESFVDTLDNLAIAVAANITADSGTTWIAAAVGAKVIIYDPAGKRSVTVVSSSTTIGTVDVNVTAAGQNRLFQVHNSHGEIKNCVFDGGAEMGETIAQGFIFRNCYFRWDTDFQAGILDMAGFGASARENNVAVQFIDCIFDPSVPQTSPLFSITQDGADIEFTNCLKGANCHADLYFDNRTDKATYSITETGTGVYSGGVPTYAFTGEANVGEATFGHLTNEFLHKRGMGCFTRRSILADDLASLGVLNSLHIYASPTELEALSDAIGSYTAINNGATFTPNEGFTGNGTTAYIDRNYSAHDNGDYTDRMHMAYYKTLSDGTVMGGFLDYSDPNYSTFQVRYQRVGTENRWTVYNSDFIFDNVIVINSDDPLTDIFLVYQTRNGNVEFYINGVLIETYAEAGVTSLAGNYYDLASNGIGAGEGFHSSLMSISADGVSMTQEQIDQAYAYCQSYMGSLS